MYVSLVYNKYSTVPGNMFCLLYTENTVYTRAQKSVLDLRVV